MANQKLIQVTDNLKSELIKTFENFHEHPELSNEEFETTKTLKKLLGEVNIKILDTRLKTGLVAEITGNSKGPVIAIRSDIDALPIEEETDLSYRSKEKGKMHACGHDFHMTSILGAAYLLKLHEDSLKGTVKIIFQPAEETSHGAEQVIKSDVLSDVQAIFGLHDSPELDAGTLGTNVGALNAAVDRFEIKIKGIGTHAAHPENGIDPIVIASNIVTALQTVISRNLSPFAPSILSVTHFEGGNTWNVIPERVYLEGTVRTLTEETRKYIPDKIKKIVEGISEGYGASAEFNWYPGPPATNNSKKWTDVAIKTAEEIGYKVEKISPKLGGEDFAFYQERIPGSFVNIGIGKGYSLHNPKFKVDKSAILRSSQYFEKLAERALDILSRNKSNGGI